MVQLNSIYQTPRDFIKILYWSCNHEETGFTEDLLRGQLERVLKNYRAAAVLLASPLESQKVLSVGKENQLSQKTTSECMNTAPDSTVSCLPCICHTG